MALLSKEEEQVWSFVCWVANQYAHADLSCCLLPNEVYNSCVVHAFLAIEELIQFLVL